MLRRVMIGIVLGFVVGGGSVQSGGTGGLAASQTQPAESSARLDMQTRDDLRLFGHLLGRHDVLRARIVAERLRGRVPEGDKIFAERLAELERQLTDQEVEVGKGYLRVRKPPADEACWREAMAIAADYRQRYGGGRAGMVVLRIRLEDMNREDHIGVTYPGLFNYARFGMDNPYYDVGSGEFLFLGRRGPERGQRWPGSERGEEQTGTERDSAQIEINLLRHTSVKLPVDVSGGDIICAGDLLIRLVPNEELGRIHVRVFSEPGVSLDQPVVRVSRGISQHSSFYPVHPDGTCEIEGIGAGPCELCAETSAYLRSPRRQVEVLPGKTTEVELQVYARRRVVIDRKWRRLGSEDGWRQGTTTAETGKPPPRGKQEGNGCAWALSDWDGTSANIIGYGCVVLPADPGDFDPPQVRISREAFRRGSPAACPIGVGKVFAMHALDSMYHNETEAVARVRSIELAEPLNPVAGDSGLRSGSPVKPAVSQTQPSGSGVRAAGDEIRLGLQTSDDLRLLGQLLERHDVLDARILSERLAGRIPAGDKTFAKHLDELERQLTDQEVEVGKTYLWAHKPPEDDPHWSERMGKVKQYAAGYIKKTAGKKGTAVLRILLEEPNHEERFGIRCYQLSTDFLSGGGSMSQELPSGGFIVLGNPYMTTIPSSGYIEIEALRHACPKLPIDLPESGIVCAGELLIRSIPKEEQGSIHLQVIPEGQFSLDHGEVHIGRSLNSQKVKYPVQPDGSCLIDGVGPGPFALYVEASKLFRTPYRQVQVAAGQTIEVEMQAYVCRRVVVDWKCHRVGSEDGWREGTTTIVTGESTWRGRQDEKGCAWGLSEWDGTSANIHGVGCGVLPAEPSDFDPPRVRASREEFRSGRPVMMQPIGIGKVFALRSFDFKADNETEAVVRIRSIEPVVPLATQPATTKVP